MYRVATFAALALDFKTWNRTYSRGVYALPEDDKDSHKLKDLSATTGREQKYENLRGQSTERHVGNPSNVHPDPYEQDIGYHNAYGAEAMPNGPLER